MNEKKRVIFDLDTGSDDAVALVYAVRSGRFSIDGICTVWGSDDVETVTEHTLMTLEMLKQEIPVYRGCAEPMVRHLYDEGEPVGVTQNWAENSDGKIVGFHQCFNFPKPHIHEMKEHAVSYLIRTLRSASEPIIIIATGALTNLACAFRMAPDIIKNIEKMIIMGGGISVSNKTMCAEGNFWRDPEAARIVLESGAPILLVPLDATYSVLVGPQEVVQLQALDTPESIFVADVILTRMQAYNALQPLKEKDRAVLHDLFCVFILLDEHFITEADSAYATVCIDRGEAAGKLLVDSRTIHEKENLTIVFRVDPVRYQNMLLVF